MEPEATTWDRAGEVLGIWIYLAITLLVKNGDGEIVRGWRLTPKQRDSIHANRDAWFRCSVNDGETVVLQLNEHGHRQRMFFQKVGETILYSHD